MEDKKYASEGMVRQIAGSLTVNLRAGGGIEFDMGQQAVGNPKRLASAVEALINNGCSLIFVGTPVIDLDVPVIPEGWSLLPDEQQIQSRLSGKWTYAPDKLVDHLLEEQKNGDWIVGHERFKKLEGQPVMRAALVDFYMANKHLIPEEYKDGKVRYADGDIYSDPGGFLYVRGFRWDGGVWYGDFSSLDYEFNGFSLALCASKPSVT